MSTKTRMTLLDVAEKMGEPLDFNLEFKSEIFNAFGFAAKRYAFRNVFGTSTLEVYCYVTTTSMAKFLEASIHGKDDLFSTDAQPVLTLTDDKGNPFMGVLQMEATLENYEICSDVSRNPFSSGDRVLRRVDDAADRLYEQLAPRIDDSNTLLLEKNTLRWVMRQSAEIRDLLVKIANNCIGDELPGTYIKLEFAIDAFKVVENAGE